MQNYQLAHLDRMRSAPAWAPVQVRGGQDDHKFLAAPTVHEVFPANAAAGTSAVSSSTRVAGVVAAGIVALLAMVEVEHREPRGLLGAHHAAKFAKQACSR
jgi:hypothetical protein